MKEPTASTVPKQRTTRPPTRSRQTVPSSVLLLPQKAIIDQNYSLNASYIANYNSVELESNPEMIFYKEYKEATLTHQTKSSSPAAQPLSQV